MYNSIDPPVNEYDEESARVLLVQRANNRSSNGRKGEGPRRRVSNNSLDSSSIASSQYNDPPSNGSGPSVCYSSSGDDSEVGTRDPPLRSDSNDDDDVGKRGRQREGRRGEKRSGLQRRDVHFASSSSSSQQQRGRPRETGNRRGNKRGAIIVDAEDVSHLTISQDYIDTIDQVSLPNDYYDIEAGEVVYDVQTKLKDGGSKRRERRRRVSLDSQSSVESRDTLLKSMMSTVSDESSIITGIRGGPRKNSQHNKYMNNNLSKSINKAKQGKVKMKGKKSNGFISSYPRPISFYNMHNIQRTQLNNNNKSKSKDGRFTFFQRLFPSAIKEEEDDEDSIHSTSTSSTSSTSSSSSSTSSTSSSTNNSNRTTKSQASQRSKIGRVANSLLMTWVFTLLGAMIILVVYDKMEPMIVKLMHSYSANGEGGEGSGVGEVMRKLMSVRTAIFHLDSKVDAVESGSSSFLT